MKQHPFKRFFFSLLLICPVCQQNPNPWMECKNYTPPPPTQEGNKSVLTISGRRKFTHSVSMSFSAVAAKELGKQLLLCQLEAALALVV
ncbi:hypothetical protein CEXT_289601 [Caerostris extrusa]|uniref:Secreted protein n=1 Tax=Caerostris extrusa TaxID=172846 RepID=A0AAV4N0M4_CAEEX|nr:hypothetical protein CEXT_289601 [Caerostris extrusa]